MFIHLFEFRNFLNIWKYNVFMFLVILLKKIENYSKRNKNSLLQYSLEHARI